MSMMDGMSQFEQRIQQAKDSYDELQQATLEAQAATRQLRSIQREVKELLGGLDEEVKKKVTTIVQYELNKISPKLREQLESILEEKQQRQIFIETYGKKET